MFARFTVLIPQKTFTTLRPREVKPPLDFHSEFRGHAFGLLLRAGQRAEMIVCGNRIPATDS